MSELERALTALAAEVEWPPTPAFELRLEPVRGRRRRRGPSEGGQPQRAEEER